MTLTGNSNFGPSWTEGDLAEVAKSVAQALGLHEVNSPPEIGWYDVPSGPGEYLCGDGYNLFSPYWRCRCLDWLLENGWVTFGCGVGTCVRFQTSIFRRHSDEFEIALQCPAAEFPARAIHAIQSK